MFGFSPDSVWRQTLKLSFLDVFNFLKSETLVLEKIKLAMFSFDFRVMKFNILFFASIKQHPAIVIKKFFLPGKRQCLNGKKFFPYSKSA